MARYTTAKLKINFETQKSHLELILFNKKIELQRGGRNARFVK